MILLRNFFRSGTSIQRNSYLLNRNTNRSILELYTRSEKQASSTNENTSYINHCCKNYPNSAHHISSTRMISNPIVWIDLEMTGLEPETNRIIEIATVITDGNLTQQLQGPDIVIHVEDETMTRMDSWCKKTFTASGLWDSVRRSRVTLKEAEDATLKFIKEHTAPNSAPLGGNSVSTDREFLRQHMPRVFAYLHYRVVDVTTVKLLYTYWYQELPSFPKKLRHRALDDILESIEELKFYRAHLFKQDICPKSICFQPLSAASC